MPKPLRLSTPDIADGLVSHYTSGQGLYPIFESGPLYLSQSIFLHDPSEIGCARQLALQILEDRRAELPTSQYAVVKRLLDDVEGVYSRTHLVFSMSRQSDSLALWNNFDAGDGYRLALNANPLRQTTFKLSPLLTNSGCVASNPEEQQAQVARLLDALISSFENFNPVDASNPYLNGVQLVLPVPGALFKREFFESQPKFRFVVSGPRDNAPKTFRSYRGSIVPYLAVEFPADDHLVEEVMCGPRNHGASANAVAHAFLEARGYPTVPVTQSQVS